MYIISKKNNKDYYDGVVGSVGIDKTIVYNREIITYDHYSDFLKEFHPLRVYNSRYKNHFLNLNNYSVYKKSKYGGYSAFIIGFCGKLYIGWKLYMEDPKSICSPSDLITDITYDYELVKKYIKTIGWHSNLDDDVEYIKTYDAINMFRELKVPIFLFDQDYHRIVLDKWRRTESHRYFLNPNLSEYEFYKVFDSFTAFQEIQMFLGGVLGAGEKEIVEVEDKYKITQHGFNKWSFRKESQKK